MSDDRRVHASLPGVAEVARYDRAGKWYVEHEDGTRARVGLTEAARVALNLIERGGTHHKAVRGGAAFDRKVVGEGYLSRREQAGGER